MPAGDVTVSGIPIHPAFSQPKDRAACLASHGLAGDRPIVLQLSGGFGVGPIEKIFRGLLEVEVPLEVVVVTGRNEAVKAQLEQIAAPDRHRTKMLGFTDKIDELMAVADIVLSKPGGLTTSEVLASGAAMAVVNPIPGPGEPQQRLPAGKRGRDQDQQHRHAAAQIDGTLERTVQAQSAERKRTRDRPAASRLHHRPPGTRVARGEPLTVRVLRHAQGNFSLDEPRVALDIFRARFFDDVFGKLGRRAVFVPAGRFEPVADELLVERGLRPCPARKLSTGQNRELSGVSTSSIRISWPSADPNSNFVSAMMIPFGRAYSAPRR